MDVITEIPSGWAPAKMSIDGFGHSWRPVLPTAPTLTSSTLPIPYEAYGQSKWVLIACKSNHTGTCAANTIQLAVRATVQFDKSIERLPIIQGVARNKRAAKQFRDSKRAAAEEEEEEKVMVVEEESESSEDEEEDDFEDDGEEEEEEEEEETE